MELSIMDPSQISALAKSLPEVAKEAYRDLISPSFKQGGLLAEDIVKAVRLVLFPAQFAGAFQDRLDGYINKAIRQVPEARLIPPTESILFPLAEKLKFQEETNPVTEMYINLLARAMDGERVGEAHPAFLNIITQLAPDEITLLTGISKNDYTIIMAKDEQWYTPTKREVRQKFIQSGMPKTLLRKSFSIVFNFESLNQPELFPVFLEHLTHLGLVQVTNQPTNEGEYKGYFEWIRGGVNTSFIRLSKFGQLFFKACISLADSQT